MNDLKVLGFIGLLNTVLFAVFFLISFFILKNKSFGYLGINLFYLSVIFSTLSAVMFYFINRYLFSGSGFLVSALSFFIFLGYSNLYNIIIPVSIERSFTVSIMLELLSNEENFLSSKRFFEINNCDDIYELRISELTKSNLIIKKNDGYQLTEKGRKIAVIYGIVNNYLEIKK